MTGPAPRRLPGWRPLAAALLFPLLAALSGTSAAQPMSIMATVGCVESGDDGRFHLVRATEPEALQERMPEEPPADTPARRADHPPHRHPGRVRRARPRGHKVWAKGLLNPADAAARIC